MVQILRHDADANIKNIEKYRKMSKKTAISKSKLFYSDSSNCNTPFKKMYFQHCSEGSEISCC